MVDIHSHILPGIDDGSPDLDESLAMLRIARESGTTDIVATPHANLEFSYQPAVVEEKIVQLREAAGELPRIHRGCDFHLSFDNVEDALANPSKYTINQKRYLLVEFNDLVIFNTTNEVFDRMMHAGMIPVITHPERNWLLQQRIEQLAKWVESGCLLQVTANAFIGQFGRRARDFALRLMERGMVHVAASDAHDSKHRTPSMAEAADFISRRFGTQQADALFSTNPQAILIGNPVEAAPPGRPRRPRWYHFWRS